MENAISQLLEGVASIGGNDPMTRGWVLLGSAGVALMTLTATLFRRKPKERVRINADFPAGQKVNIEVGEEDDS